MIMNVQVAIEADAGQTLVEDGVTISRDRFRPPATMSSSSWVEASLWVLANRCGVIVAV